MNTFNTTTTVTVTNNAKDITDETYWGRLGISIE